MPLTYENDLLLRAARGEHTERTPIWLMRQAGRTDPAYNALKERAGLPLEKLFRHPELAAEITLLPKRLGVDALIVFQDILTPLTPMGAPFVFAPGPKLAAPLRSESQIDALAPLEPVHGLGWVAETFERVHRALNGEMPVLGFAGAPLTLAIFLIEGTSFGSEAPAAMQFMRDNPALLHKLLGRLTTAMIDYLKFQAECGAAAVQLFESAAFLLAPPQYAEFALPYQQQVFEALRGIVPTIQFAREWGSIEDLGASGADIISLPAGISVADARAALGDDQVVQGNMDNGLLARGSREAITEAALACVASGQRRGHIFNLSHGLLRDTPYENIVHLVQTVRGAV